MKRDMDLIRKLLFFFEETQDTEHEDLPKIEGYDAKLVKYHIFLMHDSNLLQCHPVKSKTTDAILYLTPLNLTWEGTEFLEKIRSDTSWNKIKQTISSKGGVLTFGIINQVVDELVGQNNYSVSPDVELKWQELIDENPDDKDVHTLHALRIGLYLKVEREEITVEVARKIFENIKMLLIKAGEEEE